MANFVSAAVPAIAAPARFLFPVFASGDSKDLDTLVMAGKEGVASLLAMPYGAGIAIALNTLLVFARLSGTARFLVGTAVLWTYVELTGGRQIGLELAADSGDSLVETIEIALRERTFRPARPHSASAAELAAHEEFLAKLNAPLWLSGTD